VPYRVILPKQSAMNVSLSPSFPRRTGDTGDGGPFTGDAPVMDREQTGDGPTAAAVLAHPFVQAALELFDGEVVQIRRVSAQETPRAA
jgi:hypothetical protein